MEDNKITHKAQLVKSYPKEVCIDRTAQLAMYSNLNRTIKVRNALGQWYHTRAVPHLEREQLYGKTHFKYYTFISNNKQSFL